MATAKKLPSGAWRTQASKTINGKKIVKSFTVNPKDCNGDSKRAKQLSELRAKEWLFENDTRLFMTVSKAIDNYIADRSNVLSPSTIADYKRMPKHFDRILNEDIENVDTKMLQSLINEFAANDINSRTIRNRIYFLISAIKYNGMDKRFNLRFPSQIKPNLKPPEPSEFKRLMELATKEEKIIIILAGLYTLRRGEIGGLCGEDILDNGIYVHSSRVQDENKKWIRRAMPKNETSVRFIEIDPEILNLFPKVKPKEYLVSLNPNQITKHFERLRKKANVNCRFHDLRKYAASIRSEIMPSKYIESDGGWSKGSNVLSSIYDKPFNEKRKEYSKLINEKIKADYKDYFV